MIKVNITKAIAINLTGYDREATTLEPGEHTVPESAGAWLDANPGYGSRGPAEEPVADGTVGFAEFDAGQVKGHFENNEFVVDEPEPPAAPAKKPSRRRAKK